MKLIFTLILTLSLAACKTTTVSKQEAFPKLYNEKPSSILVLPAVNNTTAADAAALYSTTIAQPLAEAGYYVFSIPYTKEFFNAQGIVDGAQLKQIPLERFKQAFGADSVLFVNINQWDTNYYVTGGDVTVGAHFELVSTTTSDKIWQYNDVIVHNTSGNSGNLLADMIATAISTAIVDYVPIAKTVNQRIVNTIPVGKYHKKHGKDQKEAGIILQRVNAGKPEKSTDTSAD